MEEISPTRTNLLQRKAQIQLAVQGADLLKNKRDVLITEFMKIMNDLVERRHNLEDITHKAYHALARARAFDGEEALESAAMAAQRTITVDIRQKKIWGVPIPDIERITLGRTVTERGYSFAGVPARVDLTAHHFEDILTSVVAIAATDVVLRRMGDEIRRTTRRLNALEQILIPRLTGEARYIRTTLEEREREDVSRLKKIKGKSGGARKGARKGQAGKRPPAASPAPSWRRPAAT
jgi:V/A-type H+-transporting ATPase subunit D